ncbi:murein biosynthesis integral membrane protein MurJ [Anaerococcus nagyae]|uniref:murein biosynthesis integral membrane protein MurJ n=1 Tax=Anaerococcus nagyae TaxID=1755241 RepID=UPI001AE5F413|nr:murein biosynthesis integral membrane protein MurJ [Anaerococcus nagyae]MBP2068998.1 putative peptidoglycan lipid II flippase [Anaerococcus nagyae]
MGQTTIVLMILTVISKIFGFVRESVMASVIGAGDLKSIYVTATTIPDLMTYTVIVGIVAAYIPVYTKISSEKGEGEAENFTSNLINTLMIYGAIAFFIVIIFAGPISKLFSPKLTGDTLQLAKDFTRIMAISIFTFLYSSVIRGYLNAKGNFIDPAIPGIIINVFVIVSTILTGIFNNSYILIIGTLIGYIIQFVRFPFVSRKLGYSYKKTIDFEDPYIKHMFTIMIPIIISSAANKIAILIDKSMASAYLGIDSVAKIFYTENMLDFIVEVFAINIATITLPQIAKLANDGNINQMKEKTSSTLVLTMTVIIPATLGLMVLSTPIIRLIYERNAFSPADTSIVASLLVSYGPYIIFISILKIISNAFYAVGDSRSPLLIILFQQVINMVLNVFLVKRYNIDGIALATSISTIIGSICMMIAYYNRFGSPANNKNILSTGKILVSSIVMVLVAISTYDYMTIKLSLVPGLLISVLLAGIIYLICIGLSKIDVVDGLKSEMISRINDNKLRK